MPLAPVKYPEFGELVRDARERAGLSQKGLAEAVGISPGYPPQIEQGRVRPRPPVLERIAEVTGVPYIDLARRVGYLPLDPNTVAITVDRSKGEALESLSAYPSEIIRQLQRFASVMVVQRERGETASPDQINEDLVHAG